MAITNQKKKSPAKIKKTSGEKSQTHVHTTLTFRRLLKITGVTLLAILAIVVLLVILLIAKGRFDERKNIKSLIKDARTVKADIEKKFDVTLQENSDCLKYSEKFKEGMEDWGCEIKFSNSNPSAKDQEKIYTILSSYPFLEDNPEDADLSRHSQSGALCELSLEKSFGFSCNFRVSHANKDTAFNELGLTEKE